MSSLTSSTPIRLNYLPNRGYSETIRMLLAYSGQPWEDVALTTNAQFLQLIGKKKQDAKFFQLPLLEIDGMTLCQSHAICRYLAKKMDLYGRDDDDKSRLTVDIAYCGARDFVEPFVWFYFRDTYDANLRGIREKILPNYLPAFERMLGKNGGVCCDGRLSLADFTLLEALIYTEDYFPSELAKYPNLTALREKMMERASLMEYVENHQRPVNDQETCKQICETLGLKYE